MTCPQEIGGVFVGWRKEPSVARWQNRQGVLPYDKIEMDPACSGVTRRVTKTIAYPDQAVYIVRHVTVDDNDNLKVDQ